MGQSLTLEEWIELVVDEYVGRTDMTTADARQYVEDAMDFWVEMYGDGASPAAAVAEEISYWEN